MTSAWNYRAKLYDLCEGSSLRRGPEKARLFAHMRGNVLFVAVGTGLDIPYFPAGLEIVGIDISEAMVRRATHRAAEYRGSLSLVLADAMKLPFQDASFDTVATSCTMCSIPDPLLALRELCRVLRPTGHLLMFEHVRSRNRMFGMTLDLMTLWTRLSGTEMNRDTVSNVLNAGFQITEIKTVWLDVILAIRAIRPALSCPSGQLRNEGPKGLAHRSNAVAVSLQ